MTAAGTAAGDGKLSRQSLQQLVGGGRNAMHPSQEDDLAVEVVRLDVAGCAPQALPRGPAGPGFAGDHARLQEVPPTVSILLSRGGLEPGGGQNRFALGQ